MTRSTEETLLEAVRGLWSAHGAVLETERALELAELLGNGGPGPVDLLELDAMLALEDIGALLEAAVLGLQLAGARRDLAAAEASLERARLARAGEASS